MSALSIADIGLTPTVALPETDRDSTEDTPALPEHAMKPGSVMAQVVYQMWKGRECVIVKSPPGGGKSTLVANVADILRRNLDDDVTIITPTNASAVAIGKRIEAAFGEGTVYGASSGITSAASGFATSRDVAENINGGQNAIALSTIASAIHWKPKGIVIVDEAYQASFADVSQAVDSATQVLMVGDPGQIGPVITIDTAVFDSYDFGPHTPAPAVFEQNPDALVLSLESTYRLGADTAEIVADFYDFDFDSGRLPHSVDGHAEFETVEVDEVDSHASPDLLERVVERVRDLIDTTHRFVDYEMRQGHVHEVKPHHIAVVVAHNVQAAYISSRLDSISGDDHLDMVTVGTADRLQGGQWPVVVALDPLAGVSNVTDHHTSLGRLCVMLSRHTSHLSFVHEASWRTRLAEATDLPRSEARLHRSVRTRLGA